MTNRLASESSPYLLQHAENPVDWFPWGPEALNLAREKNRPIFLSIGYSACHWCHVMEHESFEDAEIAEFLNQNFVSIKVDREERPDLDQIYMQAVMALQRGQGGWPLSAFLTPDCDVFFGGTYWPPHDSRGMPGFDRVLRSVLDAYQNRRDQVDDQSKKVTEYLQSMIDSEASHEGALNPELIKQVGDSLERIFDFENGGFGRSPKFPHSMDLQVLMRLHHAELGDHENRAEPSRWMKMVCLNLDKMALGGIYDHLGGGFCRYSVDEKWLVPHFEKMLYDNALLTDAYLDAYTITGSELFRQRVEETFEYQLKYMTDPSGAFHSTEDADSEGEEGKFYVWSRAEILELLDPELGPLFCDAYDVTVAGNFEGKNILNLAQPLPEYVQRQQLAPEVVAQLGKAREQLLSARDERVRPGKDDKILVSWNALMIHSMAKGSMILGESRYLTAAIRAADFILTRMRQKSGKLFHTFRLDQAKLDGFLDDYAYLINALITLFETTGDSSWLTAAQELTSIVLDEFHDSEGGGFFFSGSSSEQLIARSKDLQDSSVPSGNSMMTQALIRLDGLIENSSFREIAERSATRALELIQRSPSAAGQMICAIDQLCSPTRQIVICCPVEQREEVLQSVYSSYDPNRIVCVMNGEVHPHSNEEVSFHAGLYQGKEMIDQAPTVFVCENFSCQKPLVGIDEIKQFFGPHDGERP